MKGIIKDIYRLPGTYFLNESGTNKGSNHDVSEALLSSVATRKIVVIESSNPKIGTIAVVYIGMELFIQEWWKFQAAWRQFL